MKSLHLLAALSALVPAVASASVYNIWATKPGTLTTLGTTQTPAAVDGSVSWNTSTSFAFVYARARTSADVTYEFQLVSMTSSLYTDRINGTWNVTRNGVVVCSQCAGSIDGLSSGVGKPFNISVDGGNYQMSPIMTNRYNIY